MKTLFFILVLLTFLNVNAQDFKQEIVFTAISTSSENPFKKQNDSMSIPSSLRASDKKVLSIYQLVNFRTDTDSLVLEKIQKEKPLSYYQIAENFKITSPEWCHHNIDAFGFKLSYIMR